MSEHESKLLTRCQAAEFLKVKPQTLAVWACHKKFNLPYVKVGRGVRYSLEDLEKWLESRKVKADVPESRDEAGGG